MVRLIVIEGNIGSGKSTFIQFIATLTGCCPAVTVLQEPVDQWQSIVGKDGRSILELFYADKSRFAFAFQMTAYISRLTLLLDALSSGSEVVICERSILCDREVFAKMLSDDGTMTQVEHQIYLMWFDSFRNGIPPHDVVYLQTSPSVALARIAKRARPGEYIPLSYLEQCHKYHEEWLCSYPPIGIGSLKIVNANVDASDEVFSGWYNDHIHPLLAHTAPTGRDSPLLAHTAPR